jgi:acetyl esterase/lipase
MLDVWQTSVTGNGPRPAVLKVHGGGWIGGARSEQFQWNLLFNALGYDVFDIDYRMPRDVDPAKWVWTNEVGDVKCALRWIVANAAKYNVDANRIGIFGHSAGANLTALAAYTRGDPKFPSSCPGPDVQLKFVVNVYLPSDLALMYETTGSAFVRDSLATYLGGSPSQVPDRYKMASPVNYVGAKLPPTILIHGLTDRVVPVEQSRIMDAALAKTGVVHEYYELPYADHGSTGTPSRRKSRAKRSSPLSPSTIEWPS